MVGQGNQIEDVHFLFFPLTTPPLWPPKHEYNAVSAITGEIWQYRTGGNLTIFDKGHDTAEEGRSRTASGSCSQAYGFATMTSTVGGSQVRLDARAEFKISQRSPKGG